MAERSGGISGLAVASVAAGVLMVRSAVRNQSPADSLREVIGKPTKGQRIGTPLESVSSGVRSVQQVGQAVGETLGELAGAASGNAGKLAAAARAFLGVPYRYGGTSRSGIDCSGLVIASMRAIGVKSVPRFTTVTFGTWARQKGALKVSPDQFRLGDVICRPGHMAIALSNSRMIHAPRPGKVVTEADIYSKSQWWGWRFFP
jgi:cell wall-associated NlpC family hydrolase